MAARFYGYYDTSTVGLYGGAMIQVQDNLSFGLRPLEQRGGDTDLDSTKLLLIDIQLERRRKTKVKVKEKYVYIGKGMKIVQKNTNNEVILLIQM